MNPSVVLLVGPQGSGKSTYCQEQLADYLRISQDDQGRSGHWLTYESALAQRSPRVVVDRINNVRTQRKRYLALAKKWGYHTRIVWLNVDRATCLARCRARPAHPTLTASDVEGALSNYFRWLQYPSRKEADELVILGDPPAYVPILDLCAELRERRYLIVGDVHGCLDELQALLEQLRFEPDQDVLISVGDLVDRGPKVRELLEFCRQLPRFYSVLGNHDDKLIRYLKGNPVKISEGLDVSLASLGTPAPDWVLPWLAGFPLIVKTPAGYVVHAGFNPEADPDEQGADDCLYLRYFGGRTYRDELNGQLWYRLWESGRPRVFFGHIPDLAGPMTESIVSLDGGLVFGGELRAYDSRDGQAHRIAAYRAYAEQHSAQQTTAGTSPAQAYLQTLQDYLGRGLLRGDRSDDGQLAIYTYTDACVYDSAWDEVTRNCRGHIYHVQTGECVARPFPKFFNLGENKESLAECFPWEQPYEIYEKMDGWLGVHYRQDGVHRVASRGSFHSSGALWASERLQEHDLSSLPDEVTLCFEIIHPEHKIILDYQGQSSLVILGAFNRHTGQEYLRGQVERWAQQTGLAIVPLLGHLSLADLQLHQQEKQQCEGYVIRFADGRRVKVKTAWYLHIARLMADLTPITIWSSLQQGKVPSATLHRIPEELRPLAEQYQRILEGQYAQAWLEVENIARPLFAQFGSDRKALALYLASEGKSLERYRGALFLLLDGKHKNLAEKIHTLIYPKGNQFVAGPLWEGAS